MRCCWSAAPDDTIDIRKPDMDNIETSRRARLRTPALQIAATLLVMAACLAGVFHAAGALHRWTVEAPIVDLRL
jgi:hypothetical protein